MELNKSQLKTIRLFSNIQTEDVESMLECLGMKHMIFKKGETISLSGEEIKNIGLVYKGCVHMSKVDLWGNESIFVVIHQGEVFGETFQCSQQFASTVSFVAATDSEIIFLPFHRVLNSCNSACSFHLQLQRNMIEQIALKNIQFIETLELLTKKSIREKILTYIGQNIQKSDTNYYTSPLSRQELANYLCVHRSALTRELNQLKQEGILDFDRNTFRYDKKE